MSGDDARWLPDPADATRWRWWDGRGWTDRVGRDGVEGRDPLPRAPWRRRVPGWAWILAAVLAVPILLLVWPLLLLVAAALVVAGIVALTTGRPTWLRLRSRRAAAVLTGAAAAFVVVVGGVAAVASPGQVPSPSTSIVAEPAATPAAPPPRLAAPTPTSTPTPTPVTVVREESVTSVIPFERTAVDDGSIPQGESRITTPGADGERTSVYRVTVVDGVETARELVSESVGREPVREVTSVGTYVAPPPPAQLPASDGCHSSYADACVPIDSDVDCGGGSGNGPSYFWGVARVVGPDEYDLDRDGDGWACEP